MLRRRAPEEAKPSQPTHCGGMVASKADFLDSYFFDSHKPQKNRVILDEVPQKSKTISEEETEESEVPSQEENTPPATDFKNQNQNSPFRSQATASPMQEDQHLEKRQALEKTEKKDEVLPNVKVNRMPATLKMKMEEDDLSSVSDLVNFFQNQTKGIVSKIKKPLNPLPTLSKVPGATRMPRAEKGHKAHNREKIHQGYYAQRAPYCEKPMYKSNHTQADPNWRRPHSGPDFHSYPSHNGWGMSHGVHGPVYPVHYYPSYPENMQPYPHMQPFPASFPQVSSTFPANLPFPMRKTPSEPSLNSPQPCQFPQSLTHEFPGRNHEMYPYPPTLPLPHAPYNYCVENSPHYNMDGQFYSHYSSGNQ
eukprot:Sdes_comp20269_c1_seq1m13810